MASHFQERESLPKNLHLDALYCEEEAFGVDCSGGFELADCDFDEIHSQHRGFFFGHEHDLFWEDDEIGTLLSREKDQTSASFSVIISDASLKTLRNEAIKWMLKVVSRYGFSPSTAFLAANYYNYFITSLSFQRDKPWMSQLTSVACLSIASKVEETHVPLLLDLQVEGSKYVFEAKTIQRMELLILSTLKWRMNHVTPISFFDHFSRRFKLVQGVHCEFFKRCESILLLIVSDIRFVLFPPSIIAAAAMKYVLHELDPGNAEKFDHEIMISLRANKVNVLDCHELIMEVTDHESHKLGKKRKHTSVPSSPSGVIDAYFSSDSSSDSWVVASSASSSPDRSFSKRSRDENHC